MKICKSLRNRVLDHRLHTKALEEPPSRRGDSPCHTLLTSCLWPGNPVTLSFGPQRPHSSLEQKPQVNYCGWWAFLLGVSRGQFRRKEGFSPGAGALQLWHGSQGCPKLCSPESAQGAGEVLPGTLHMEAISHSLAQDLLSMTLSSNLWSFLL